MNMVIPKQHNNMFLYSLARKSSCLLCTGLFSDLFSILISQYSFVVELVSKIREILNVSRIDHKAEQRGLYIFGRCWMFDSKTRMYF